MHEQEHSQIESTTTSQELPQTELINPSLSEWEILFNSLLPEKYNFQVTLQQETLVVTTQDAAMVAKLNEVLRSPEAVLSNVNYSLSEMGENSVATLEPIDEIVYPEPITLEHGNGKFIFERIFGDANLTRIGQVKWQVELNDSNEFILMAPCEAELEDFTQLQLKMCKKYLCSATFFELRKAIAKDTSQYQPLTSRSDTSELLVQHIEKILYMSSDKKIVYFDYGLLVKCLTPPPVATTENTLQNFTLRIEKNHFMSYLSVIFKEGFVLHITGNQARPICFNMQRAIAVENSITLILDRSESMKGCFSDYIGMVKAFIDKLASENTYQNAPIQITTFSTEIDKTFNSRLNELDTINEYLDHLESDGSTRLYDTIEQKLNSLRDKMHNTNQTLIIFTDGSNNEGKMETTDVVTIANELRQHANPPKIYTMGLGSEYNDNLFQFLSRISGAEHIKLDSIQDFDKIFNHLNKMGLVRRLAQFVQDLKTFTVPAYEGLPSVAEQVLNFPGKFQVDNKTYDAQAGGLQLNKAEKTDPEIPETASIEASIEAPSSSNLVQLIPIQPIIAFPENTSYLSRILGMWNGSAQPSSAPAPDSANKVNCRIC